MVIVALFLALPLDASAQEPPWDVFTGNGFIDDVPVPDGTLVEAWIRDAPVASAETVGSQYQIYIEQPPGEFFQGQFIKFTVNGYDVDHQHGWEACTQARSALYAYTGPQRGGYWKPDPDSDAVRAVSNLQARLAELERERFGLSAELEHQVEIETANLTNVRKGAIEELRAEVEREIQRIKRKFEEERRQIPLGSRREAMVRALDLAIESAVQEKWADFESQSRLNLEYLRDDFTEIKLAKDRKLNEAYQRIYQAQAELQQGMQEIGVPISYPSEPGESIDQCPRPPRNLEENIPRPRDPDPNVPTPEEAKPNRGFFTNSISTDPDGLNQTLDPTTLAVIGILITLAATGVQLVRGN